MIPELACLESPLLVFGDFDKFPVFIGFALRFVECLTLDDFFALDLSGRMGELCSSSLKRAGARFDLLEALRAAIAQKQGRRLRSIEILEVLLTNRQEFRNGL